MSSTKIQELVIDTSAFFAKISQLRSFIEQGTKLSTIDLVVFEFTKLMQVEIREATKAGKRDRLDMLKAIRDRFPELLSALGIEIKSPEFGTDDLLKLYAGIAKGQDAGDCMIWLKMQRAGLDYIVTQNTTHWKKLGANVVPV